jgi:hypothetical protein
MNSLLKNVNFINSSQNEGLSPSCKTLSFDGFGSISWHSIWLFWLLYSFHNFFFRFPTYHWRDLISENVHLVHQNWYRISFTFEEFMASLIHFHLVMIHKMFYRIGSEVPHFLKCFFPIFSVYKILIPNSGPNQAPSWKHMKLTKSTRQQLTM